MTRVRLAAVVAAGGAAAVLAWWLCRAGDEPVAVSPRDAADASAPSGLSASAAERRVVEPATLAVRVVDASGRDADAWVSHRVFDDVSPAEDLVSSGVRTDRGRITLDVVAGRATWVHARQVGRLAVQRYLRVPPFSGRREVELCLAADARRVHVFVLRPDMAGPAAGASVRLHGVGVDGTTTPVASLRTDETGYAVSDALRYDSVVACGPGADLGGFAPYTTRVFLSQGDAQCTLVAKPAGSRVRLHVHLATGGARVGHAPMLSFRRLGDGFQEAVWLRRSLRPGHQLHEVLLWPGHWTVDVMPAGGFECSPDVVRFGVDGQRDIEVTLCMRPRRQRTEIVLSGPEHSDFPLTVSVRTADDVRAADRSAWFCGPYRWRSRRMRAPLPAGEWQIVANGPTGPWLSRDTVSVDGSALAVDLQRACRVDLEWLCPRDTLARVVIVEVHAQATTETVLLRRDVVTRGGRPAPALVGHAIVPRGDLRIVATDSESGARLWERTADGSEPFTRLVVE